MRFEFFVALRYLQAKRREAAISIITLISVLGVMVGVCALVIALALNNGFRRELEQKLLGASADVTLLKASSEGIPQYEELSDRLARLPHVVATSPALYEQVLISSHSRAQGVILKGVDLRREPQVSDVLKKLREGSVEGLAQTFSDADPIILGKELARSLGVSVGDTLMITSPQGYLTPLEIVPKFRHFRVVGVFDSGFYDYDASWTFTNLKAAQRLFDLPNVASVIQFKIDDLYQAEGVAEAIRQAAGPGFESSTWMEQNRSLFKALRLERIVAILTIGLIEVVAALNIFITLTMMVMEKNRDIAVLMSMGARKRQVWAVFTLHGLLIGAVGTLLGLGLGYGAAWFGERYKFIPLDEQVYALPFVPFHAQPLDGIWIALAALTISLIATVYPSRAAAKLNPVEILRYE
ncbi:MAG: FtsX-like permease family protein [Terriglobia bacterium]